MSTVVPTPVPVLASEYADDDLAFPIQNANTDAITGYKNAFTAWVQGGQTGPAPSPPLLASLDRAKAIAIYETWNQAWVNAISMGHPVPVLDVSSAISYAQMNPYQPLPAPTPIADPVGPLLYTDSAGVGHYANVYGEKPTDYPNGTQFTDARGTFTHVVTPTPFFMESEWQLPAPKAVA